MPDKLDDLGTELQNANRAASRDVLSILQVKPARRALWANKTTADAKAGE